MEKALLAFAFGLLFLPFGSVFAVERSVLSVEKAEAVRERGRFNRLGISSFRRIRARHDDEEQTVRRSENERRFSSKLRHSGGKLYQKLQSGERPRRAGRYYRLRR